MSTPAGAGRKGRAPTLEDVAQRAGVSRALVSLVMRRSPKVSDARRARVLEAAAELGYRPNALARGLASRQTMTLGVLIHELRNPFYAEIMDGLTVRATDRGYRILIGTSGGASHGEAAVLEMFLEHQVDGIVLLGSRLPAAAITRVAASTAIVLVARGIRSPLVDSITNDEITGARLVISHLAGLGHRWITHVDGGRGAGAGARRAGYLRAMRERGLDAFAATIHGDYTDSAGRDAASTLLESPELPTAVFTANDFVAAGLITELGRSGIAVPGDISVVGYDNTYLAGLHHISLTTVNQPRPTLGQQAVDLVIERIEGRTSPVHAQIAPTLVVRSSTAPPRASTPDPADRTAAPARERSDGARDRPRAESRARS